MSHPIPEAALSQHIAILGKTGSGKTYAAKGVVERILSEGGRVCVIDPTGAWHGLRSSATSKTAGFPVVIFGGSHADLPLGGAHGDALVVSQFGCGLRNFPVLWRKRHKPDGLSVRTLYRGETR